LIKIKYDTINFHNLEIGKLFNFQEDPNKPDPLLIHPSIDTKNVAVGAGIKALYKYLTNIVYRKQYKN